MVTWVAITALVLGPAIYLWASGIQFATRVETLRRKMQASQMRPASGATSLPEIVRAYAIRAGGRVGGAATVGARHEAMLSTAPHAQPIALKADQCTGTITPGMVWSAHGTWKGLPISVLDAYVDGRGELSARVLGSFAMAGGSGPDYDKGELQRYLSELPVYPDAILNNAALHWRQLDSATVEVSAESRSGRGVVRFSFDPDGDIVGMEADDRPMTIGKASVPTPWHGTYANYRQFGSYRIPTYGEVGWLLAEGLFTYWRGHLVAYEPRQ